jgi:DNA polymerase I
MNDPMRVMNPSPLLEKPTSISKEDSEFQIFLAMARLPEVKRLGVDTESNGQSLKDGRGFTIGISIDFAVNESMAYSYYFPFRHKVNNISLSYRDELKELIEKGGKEIVCHHTRHDILAMSSLGINCPFDFNDTMLLAHSVDENKLSYRLDYISKELGLPGKARDKHFDQAIKLLGWDGMPPSSMGEYAATDATLLRPIYDYYKPIYDSEDGTGGELWTYDKRFMLLLNNIELTGAKVDLALAERELERGEARMKEISKELGLNPGSRNDLEELLIRKLELPVVRSSPKTDNPSFDKKAMEVYEGYLEKLNSPVAKLVLEYRGYQKATSSYWKAYINHVSPDGRIRPNFNLHRTVTHRLSCDTPNTQQIPRVTQKEWSKYVKQGFIAEDGYSQLEFRLGAAYAHQTDLIEIFNDPNRDIFDEMSVDLNMLRHDTKTLNYTIQFGGGVNRISEAFGIPKENAKFIRDNYFNTYTGFRKIIQMASQTCEGQGFVRTWSGRRRHFEDRYGEAHKAFNAVIQGGAADIVKRQMIRLADAIGWDNPECRMILQVHDSIVFEILKSKVEYYSRIIKKVLEDVVPDFGVKFKVDVHEWGKG